MKKLRKSLIVVLGVALTFQFAQGQNYKAPKMDASGKITNEQGQFIGTVTKEGTMNGTCLVKYATGKVISEVHENYKKFGACAIHCLTTPMTIEHH